MKALLFQLFSAASTVAYAESSPEWVKTPTCKTPKICYDIDGALEDCKAKKKKACDRFVDLYKEALADYQCPELAKGQDVAPTIQRCGGQERYLEFLSKLKSKKARKVFGSPELRKTLDGDLAETYQDASIAAGKGK